MTCTGRRYPLVGCCRDEDEHPLQSEHSWNAVRIYNRRPGSDPDTLFMMPNTSVDPQKRVNTEDYTDDEWTALVAKMNEILVDLPFDEVEIPEGAEHTASYRMVTDKMVSVIIPPGPSYYNSFPVDIQSAQSERTSLSGNADVIFSTTIETPPDAVVPFFARVTSMTKVRYKYRRDATSSQILERIYRSSPVTFTESRTNPPRRQGRYWEQTPWETWGHTAIPIQRYVELRSFEEQHDFNHQLINR